MSGAGLRWERMTNGTEFAFSGTVCVGSAGTRGMCVWRCEVSGTGGSAVSPEAARAEVEAAWATWCASAGLGTVGWRTIETAPDGPLMLFSPGDGGNAPGGVVWVSGGWRYAFLSGGFRGDQLHGDQLHGEPTHWRPLPGPPAEGDAP